MELVTLRDKVFLKKPQLTQLSPAAEKGEEEDLTLSSNTPAKRTDTKDTLRMKNQEFYVQKIERDIDFSLLHKAFKEKADTIANFVKENLKQMIVSLIESHTTQKRNLFEDKHVCDLKVRFFKGEIQVLVKSGIGKGGFKTVEKVTQLAGPYLPHQPGPIYVYAKVEERKALRQQLKNLEQEIAEAKVSKGTPGRASELQHKKTKLQAKIEHLQEDLLEEAAISKQFPSSDVIQMWVVTNQKDPSCIKGVMMELCEDGDLWDFVDHLTYPLSPPEIRKAIVLATHIAKALADMHTKGKGRCHLDVKSGNILLTARNGRIVPKLTDFGLSQYTGATLKHPCGTPAYIAPELYGSAQNAQPTMDTWSFGIVCIELFYGLSANLFLWDKEANSAAKDFFNRDRYPKNKALWERLGEKMKENLGQYPAIDDIIRHLLDVNPLTRWTAQEAAVAFRVLCGAQSKTHR
jgi:serine/threonine protein kinase